MRTLRLSLLAIVLAISFSPLTAQDISASKSAAQSGEWQTDSLDGFVLKRFHRYSNNNLPGPLHDICQGAAEYICILEISPNSHGRLAFSYEPRRTKTSLQARRHNALAAVNGSFFDMNRHNPICYLRINGRELGINTPQQYNPHHRKYYQYGTITINQGRAAIVKCDSSRTYECQLPDSNIMTAGPLLIYHGEVLHMPTDKTFITQRHNRTALGIKADGTVLLVTVDGRTRESEGMTIPELTSLMIQLQCTDAINLDGGGSTTMYVDGYAHDGIVNHPSDNGLFDYNGERTVSNCILIVRE